jgi:ABC-type uncharacterized transport system involved in gliding motility auxiliary subunit
MSKLGKISFLFAFISIACVALIRYIVGDWVPFCTIAVVMTVLFFGYGVYTDRRFFKDFFTMKTTKHGMNMGVMILLVLGILAIVNFLAVRHTATWDFSVSRSNTLSEQSVKLVKNLNAELLVRFFYKKGVEGNDENRRQFRELIKKYQDQNPTVQLEFVEVNERPDLAKEYGVDKGSGVVFLDYKGRRNRIEKIDEQEFTSALVKVTREKQKTLYFTVGHGEKSLDEKKEGLGLGSLKLMLDNNRYDVKTLALSQNPKIPADADVVVIAGPIQDFQGFEITALEEYLKSGGGLFLALESQNTAGLEKLLSRVGIKFQNDYVMSVVDTVLGRGLNQGPTMGNVFAADSKITSGFAQGEVTLFRYPSSLTLDKVPVGIAVDEIVKTNENSMSYKSLTLSGDGPKGPFTLVDFVKGKFPGSDKNDFSMIVAGDVDFVTNQMLYQNLNRDLVLNSIAALAKEESLISITPKEAQATEMMLTPTKFGLFLFCFVIPLPLILLGLAIGLWIKRRNA